MADVARLRAFAPAPPWRLIAVGLLILALVAVALLAVGSQRRPAPPFGPASNGQVVHVSDGDLYAADPVSGATKLLVGGPETDSAPSYSPDGTKVAFMREAGCCPQRFDLYVARDDGSGAHKVNAASFADLVYANWTPDGRHLAVIDNSVTGDGLFLLDVDGGNPPRQLAATMDIADAVVFRPPLGREIAFRALVEDGWGLFVMNDDGTNIRPLLDPVPVEMDMHAASIVYSPDGQQLFYQSYTPASADRAEGCCQLWVMNADGTNAHRFDKESLEAWSGVPAVSPDGQWVSYWYVHDAATHQVHVAPADGTGYPNRTGPEMADFVPWAWSPDSSKILLAPVDASETAYLLNPEGGPFETVPWGAEMDWQRLAP
jgi:Tol biopolymer transport system component